MSPLALVAFTGKDGFPRVSGDEPTPSFYRRITRLFSPRERG